MEKKHYEVEGRKVAVLGLGRSGEAACRFLRSRGAIVFGSDIRNRAETKAVASSLEEIGVSVELGIHSNQILTSDFIVVSPGIPWDREILQQARKAKITVVSEIELASSFLTCPMIAVTGTNGKSFTTALIGEILKEDGRKVAVGGNTAPGIPLSAVVDQNPEIVVAEISTYQLEGIDGFHPWVGILTNLSPDHLDRHKNFEEYAQLKGRLFHNQTGEDFAILNGDDPDVILFTSEILSKKIYFSRRRRMKGGVFVEGDKVISVGREETTVCELENLPFKAEFYLENYLAAITASLIARVEKENLIRALQTFQGLPHRMEEVLTLRGVRFVNNSMCTNPTACARSFEPFEEPILLIAGGKEKRVNPSVMVEAIKRRAKVTLLIGEVSVKLEGMLRKRGVDSVWVVPSLEVAVEMGFSLASPGDTVLFSPGFASYDMFRDFQERGDVFMEAVRKLEGKDATQH
ncbi:UDP-N-acetylmuramoyl-L-alanine--D-glutamate ligase [candidate division TA06 bacterium]|nr:UDP-N-acetylmuramoyl-L-alanine--D-glutamate ligase [candidate division TA06 bacterium]